MQEELTAAEHNFILDGISPEQELEHRTQTALLLAHEDMTDKEIIELAEMYRVPIMKLAVRIENHFKAI